MGQRFDAQIFLHTADREWVMRKNQRMQFWEGTKLSLWDGLTLINCGGHFEGGTVLHCSALSRDRGRKSALLTGDMIKIVQDRRYVSFMRSYPNLIPLGSAAIQRILERIEPFQFEQIYGAWWKANVLVDAKAAVARSAERYLQWISRRRSFCSHRPVAGSLVRWSAQTAHRALATTCLIARRSIHRQPAATPPQPGSRTSRVANRESGVSSGFTSMSSPPQLARSAQSMMYPNVAVVPATITVSQAPRSRWFQLAPIRSMAIACRIKTVEAAS